MRMNELQAAQQSCVAITFYIVMLISTQIYRLLLYQGVMSIEVAHDDERGR
jgi:hypothetical protein